MASSGEILRIIQELQGRQVESLHLYQAQEQAIKFHLSHAPERLARGSNQSGKTLASAVEVIRAITGQDPYNKYPKGGLAIFVGLDMRAINKNIWGNIGKPGAFSIIETEKGSGKYRPYQWWTDAHRERESVPAPPLLEERYIVGGYDGIAWYEKKADTPKFLKTTAGWEVAFLTSRGAPPNGWRGNLAWFDEEVENERWYPEIAARLIARGGKFIWDACPQVGSIHLYKLHERAQKELGLAKPITEEFFFLLDENKYIPTANKQLFYSKLSDAERRVRYHGEYIFDEFKVFPEWDRNRHTVRPFPIPPEWTRYLFIDPGRQVCAVLFAAVPPSNNEALKDHVFFYDELYIQQCTAEKFGDEVAAKCKGQQFQAFIIDRQQSRIHDMGHGVKIEVQYSDALQTRGIKSNASGYGFFAGSTDVHAGILRCRSWLQPTSTGHTKLQVFSSMFNFQNEIGIYHNQSVTINGERVMTDQPLRKHDHLMTCFRYAAMFDPQWVVPKIEPKALSPAYLAFQDFKRSLQRMRGGQPHSISFGPPGG